MNQTHDIFGGEIIMESPLVFDSFYALRSHRHFSFITRACAVASPSGQTLKPIHSRNLRFANGTGTLGLELLIEVYPSRNSDTALKERPNTIPQHGDNKNCLLGECAEFGLWTSVKI
jgi:hypothetical protein